MLRHSSNPRHMGDGRQSSCQAEREHWYAIKHTYTHARTPKRGAHECTLTRNKSVPQSVQHRTISRIAPSHRTAQNVCANSVQNTSPYVLFSCLRAGNLGYIIVFPRAVFSIDFVGVSVDYMICGGLRFECIRMCVL